MILARIVDKRFQEIVGKLSKEKLPLKVAFKLKGIVSIINQETAKYEELRVEIVKKHADKDDSGNLKLDDMGNANVSPENIKAFAEDMAELSNINVELGSVELKELGDNLSLTVEDLLYLDGVIVEDKV